MAETMMELDKPKGPQIMLQFLRDPKTGAASKIRTVPFKAGIQINRCGRSYVVDANGTQRRVK